VSTYILAGGSGFLGRHLAAALTAGGHQVLVLTRNPAQWRGAGRALAWDGATLGPWQEALRTADGIINLTGKAIAHRPTQTHKNEAIASRVNSVRVLRQAVEALEKQCGRPPPVWVQFSAIGWYGDQGERVCTEDLPAGTGFLADICRPWEESLDPAPRWRQVILRPGLVVGEDGGAMPIIARITRLGLGGSAGSGRQRFPWIHVEDLVRMTQEALFNSSWQGAYNACTPEAPTYAEFMRGARRHFGRPWVPAMPAPAMRLVCWMIDNNADLVLTGCHAEPVRALSAGFTFRYPDWSAALRAMYPNGS
jgi:uncharacterized protein (TIGR01777 family)